MKSLGKKPDDPRLERMKASRLWSGESFRDIHPIQPGLRDPAAPKVTPSEFLRGGARRVPLDLVRVSHDHDDPLDSPTIRELARLQAPFVTSLGVGAHLEAWGVAPECITELDGWESPTLPGTQLSVTAAPSQHFSGRGLKDRNATLWSSLVVHTPRHSVFFSGDTGLTNEYTTIRERFGKFDLVMLEVGTFHPSWGDIHLGPEHALEALALPGDGAFLPVHWALSAWPCTTGTRRPKRCSRSARNKAHNS